MDFSFCLELKEIGRLLSKTILRINFLRCNQMQVKGKIVSNSLLKFFYLEMWKNLNKKIF